MSRTGRLRSSRDFRAVYLSGARAACSGVVVVVSTRADGVSRTGITASRRVGSAVARNRAKRRLRASLQILEPELGAGTDVVLQATTATLGKNFQELIGQMRDGLRRAGALRG